MSLNPERTYELLDRKLPIHTADWININGEVQNLAATHLLDRHSIQKGGSAEVYRAISPTKDEEYALKVYYPGYNIHQCIAEVLSQVTPQFENNIVPVTDVFSITWFDATKSPPRLAIEMPWLDPKTTPNLKKYLLEQPKAGPRAPTLEDHLTIILEVAHSLAEAHSKGIIHRDVKPSNIMYDPKDKIARLGDWGNSSLVKPFLTNIVATPLYCAPEQLVDSEDDPSIDVYSLGLMGFEILYRECLRAEFEDTMDLLYAVTKQGHDRERLAEFFNRRDRIRYRNEEDLKQISQKVLAYKPEHRYQTPTDYTEDLIDWYKCSYG